MNNKIPMWHRRFMEAQNLLSQATSMMRQAHLEDKNNPTFAKLYKQMSATYDAVCTQSTKNLARGRKEGFIK